MMKVGDSFSSYEDFNKALSVYKKRTYNEYWRRDARTIENQRKRHPDTVVNAKEILKYYYLVVACVKGGRKFQSKHENSKRNCTTSKQDCSAAIYLHLSKCKQLLTVTKINENHNHKTSKAYFSTFSKKRLIQSLKLKEDVNKVLKAGVNKKHILEPKKCTGQKPKLLRKENKIIHDCVKMLKKTYKCDVDIFRNEDDIIKGLYFQDHRMKQYFEAFPEVLFIDVTYCLDTKTSTYIIMVEDGNGLCEIVAVCLLMQDDEESFEYFSETFKTFNPEWDKVQVIMSDKDNSDGNVLKKHFPDAKLMIPLCKVFQILNTDITSRKMGIKSEEVKTSKQYFHKIAYASSESEYKHIHKNMMDNVPTIVQTYYQNNWANITEQWVKYLTFKNLCLFSSNNNGMESLHSKLKSIINSYSLLDDFIKNLFALIKSHRIEKDIKITRMLYKNPVKSMDKNSTQHFYANLLTTFAFEKVKQQLELSETCKGFTLLGNYTFIANTSEGLLHITVMHCECTFRTSAMLPCQHIFRCRTLLSLPLFDENLCLQRWTKSYCESILNGYEINNKYEPNNSEHQVNSQMKHLTPNEKYKLMDEQGKLMAQICSDVSTPIFYERLNMIKIMIKTWKDGYIKNSNSTLNCDNTQQKVDSILQDSINMVNPLLESDSESQEMGNNTNDETISESHDGDDDDDDDDSLSDDIEETQMIEDQVDSTSNEFRILKKVQPKEIENTAIEMIEDKIDINIKNCYEENYLDEEYLEEDLLE